MLSRSYCAAGIRLVDIVKRALTVSGLLVGFVASAQVALANCNLGGSPCIAYQNRTQASAASVPLLTIPNHFVDPGGLNQALVVCVAVQAAQYPHRIEAVYAADRMTLNVSNSVSGIGVAMFTLVNPATGLNDVVINFEDNNGNPITANAAAAVAIPMSGVDQTGPVLNGNFLIGAASGAAVTLVTRDGGVSVDVLATKPGIETTPSADQTQNWTADLATLHVAGSARENTAPGRIIMRHTLRAAATWIKAGISLRPAVVTPTP